MAGFPASKLCSSLHHSYVTSDLGPSEMEARVVLDSWSKKHSEVFVFLPSFSYIKYLFRGQLFLICFIFEDYFYILCKHFTTDLTGS